VAKKAISVVLVTVLSLLTLGAMTEESIIPIHDIEGPVIAQNPPVSEIGSIVPISQEGMPPAEAGPIQSQGDPTAPMIQQPNQENPVVPPGEQAPVAQPLSISTPTFLGGIMGDTLLWVFQATGADYIMYKVEHNGVIVREGRLSGLETSFSMNAASPGAYTLILTAWRGSDSRGVFSVGHMAQSQSPMAMEGRLEAAEGVLTVRLISSRPSLFYGQTVELYAEVTGGTAPYTTHITLSFGGQIVAQGGHAVSYTMTSTGDYIATAHVTDANGASASVTCVIPCALHRTESLDEIMPNLPLTGDWAQDISAAAQSQLGYMESTRDFILNEEGKQRGYTRYGDWYDQRHGNGVSSEAFLYGEWCVMFVVFCADIAQIPTSVLPRHTGASSLAADLRKAGWYFEAKEHTPAKGDLVFINSEGHRGKEVDHVGIVLAYVDGVLTTIEGNANRRVDIRMYDMNSRQIKGFAPVRWMQNPQAMHTPSQPRAFEASWEQAQQPLSAEAAQESVKLYNSILMGAQQKGVLDAPPKITRSDEFTRIVSDIIDMILE